MILNVIKIGSTKSIKHWNDLTKLINNTIKTMMYNISFKRFKNKQHLPTVYEKNNVNLSCIRN